MSTHTHDDPRPLVDIHVAAGYLGVVSRTLRRWSRSGYGPTVYRIGRTVRYDLDEVREWAKAQALVPEAPSDDVA